MQKVIIPIVLAILIIGGGAYYFWNRQGAPQTPPKPANGYQKPPSSEKPPTKDSKLNTYETLQGGFSASYPTRMETTNIPNERRIAGSLLDRYYNEAGLLGFIGIYVPQSEFPRTTFSEAEINISATGARPCDINRFIPNRLTPEGTKLIANRPFTKYASSEGAAGHNYSTAIYSHGEGDLCLVIEETAHSTPAAYDPNAGITAYDEGKLRTLLDSVIDGFRIRE